MSKIKIAITGKMGSGKSSLAKLISKIEDSYITSFSSKIKDIIVSLDLEPNRIIMQETGDFFRSFDNVVWVNALLKETNSISKCIIIDGIRYPFERDKLALEGFKIIKIISSDNLRRKRLEMRDKITITDNLWVEWNKHGTELQIEQINSDFEIENNDTLESLHQNLIQIIQEIKEFKI